jgi:Polyketide cyclase / dehydrase and lipid transport
MKWFLLAVALVTIALAAMAAIGWRLPVKHRATRKARFRRPPTAIFAIVSGPPDWRPEVKAWNLLPDSEGRKRWWEQDSRGKKIGYELLESSPSRLVTRIADRNLPYGGTWTFEFAPAGENECDVRVTEDGEIYNVVFRFLSRYVFGYHGAIEGYLRNLGARLSEQPKIEA